MRNEETAQEISKVALRLRTTKYRRARRRHVEPSDIPIIGASDRKPQSAPRAIQLLS